MAIETPDDGSIALAYAILHRLHFAMPKQSLAHAAVLLEAAVAEYKDAPLCQSDIVARLGLSQPTASRIIAAMARGSSPLITIIPDPAERRRTRIHLGAAGRALIASLTSDHLLPPN